MSETQTATSGRDAARIRNAKRRRRLIVNGVVGGAVILALALLAISHRGKPRGPEGLMTGTVERADLVQTISATGSITAQTGAMVKIGSQITGRIKRLHADVGDLELVKE